MLDEETLRATRYNSKRLTVSLEDNLDAGDEDSGSGADETPGESFAMAQRPPAPPPRPRRFASPDRGAEALSPTSTCSEKVRSLPSVTAYKPLPPLPADQQVQSEDASSLDSSIQVRIDKNRLDSTRLFRCSTAIFLFQGSPTSSSSGKKHSVTFCDNEVISVKDRPATATHPFRAIFRRKKSPATKTKPVLTAPTPILMPRPMSSVTDRRHLPLTKRLSNKLKEPFAEKN